MVVAVSTVVKLSIMVLTVAIKSRLRQMAWNATMTILPLIRCRVFIKLAISIIHHRQPVQLRAALFSTGMRVMVVGTLKTTPIPQSVQFMVGRTWMEILTKKPHL